MITSILYEYETMQVKIMNLKILSLCHVETEYLHAGEARNKNKIRSYSNVFAHYLRLTDVRKKSVLKPPLHEDSHTIKVDGLQVWGY